MKERKIFKEYQLPRMEADFSDDSNIFQWHGTIIGPEDTPYEDGVFLLDIRFPEQYPFRPPKIVFTTRIYHPNIDLHGHLNLDVLTDHWSPALTIIKIMFCIQNLLKDPNPDYPFRPEIGREMKQDYELFCLKARKFTKDYAM